MPNKVTSRCIFHELLDQSQEHSEEEEKTSCLLIGPLPKAAHEEDDGDGGLEVSADGLDVDEELATLTGLDDWNPQNGHHNQHKHKHSAAHTSNHKTGVMQ